MSSFGWSPQNYESQDYYFSWKYSKKKRKKEKIDEKQK
jgi:hypothetical protein